MTICNSWMENNPQRKAQLLRLEAISEALGNTEIGIADAADRLLENRPAFWRSTGYNDQFTGGVCDLANIYGDLLKACETKRVWTEQRATKASDMLDCLIPLNPQAFDQLRAAYALAGTFRAGDEIAAREQLAVRKTERVSA